MKLDFIALDKLDVSKANMRGGKRPCDIADILPSIRARGVLVPVLVRPNGSRATFEIVAGRRRFEAARIVAGEAEAPDPATSMLPCAIIEAGDDAAALEASLIENVARLDPDEVTRWETFTRLVRSGRTAEDIATTFGLPDIAVRRTLALGNLLPRIRDLYRKGEIDATTIRHLTLASNSQQKAWFALADEPDGYRPTGHQLKAWLFGGPSIPVKYALFDPAAEGGPVVTDLFGEGGYFADADLFWAAQNAMIDARRAAYLEAGWSDVVIVPPSDHFATWEYEKAQKRKGGRVYIDVRSHGEVIVHEGYISAKEAQRIARGDSQTARQKPARPELTAALQTYIDLHRHAAVRADLVAHPPVALRLMVAHAIAGSQLWRVTADPRVARSDAIAESAENSPAEAVFDASRRAVLALLGVDPDAPTVIGADRNAPVLFQRLLTLSDAEVMAVLTIIIGETLACGGDMIEAVGRQIGTDMAVYWQADAAFFSLTRDREVLGQLVAEVAGDSIAAANKSETTKVLKAIISDHLTGENGRSRVTGWVPRWMRFPPSAYTERGGVGTVTADARGRTARAVTPRSMGDDDRDGDPDRDPDPCAPAGQVALPALVEPSEPQPLAA